MIVIVLIGALKDVVTYLSFKANQDYISAFLCVNRTRIDNTCLGHCQLDKTIIENHTRDDDSTLPAISEVKENFVFLIFDKKMSPSLDFIFIEKKSLFELPQMIDNHYISDIFHPPQVG